MKKLEALEPFVFYAILALWIVPLWSLDFFVTGDGPCHLYNSKILLDWYRGGYKDFYDPFYFLNTNFEPNWLFNLITTPLLAWFSPGTAEKIFLTLYVSGFGLGFRYLISRINPAATFISSLGLLFCCHKLVTMGFFNNSLSLMLWFWLAGWWWHKRDDFRLGTLIKTALLMLLLYSAHPMGLSFAGMMMAAMLAGLLLYETNMKGWAQSRDLFLKRLKGLVLSALPMLLLFMEFAFRREWSKDSNTPDIKDTLEKISRLSSLVTLNHDETGWAIATSVACLVLLVAAIVLRIRERRFEPADGLILFFGMVIYSIINPPSSFSGGLEVPFRMGLIPFFAALFWAATAQFPAWAKLAGQTVALVLTLGFLSVRMPVLRNASDYAKEIYSCNDAINAKATILTLNYDWTGHTPEGQPIADRIWLFNHVDCYLGASRSAVISDNYEANFWYFPTIARWNTNMYQQTDKDGINFDNRPPRADMLSYNRRTSQQIDYVLMLSYTDEFKDHEYTKEIFSQLEQGFEQIFVSEHKRAVLYKRRGL